MMWRDVIDLGNATPTTTHGETIYSFTWRTAYANKRSVKQSEFYQASDVGLKPELVFEVRSSDFDNDERIRYGGVEYSITRVEGRGDNTLLTVAAYVGSEV